MKSNHRYYFVGEINTLRPEEIFVFGSNEAGIHGSGAAKLARDKFHAVLGEGDGFTGWCYGIPTKDRNIETLPLTKIQFYVNNFINTAMDSSYTFLVTQIGCGLAGYTPANIAPLFKDAPSNCIFDIAWKDYLK